MKFLQGSEIKKHNDRLVTFFHTDRPLSKKRARKVAEIIIKRYGEEIDYTKNDMEISISLCFRCEKTEKKYGAVKNFLLKILGKKIPEIKKEYDLFSTSRAKVSIHDPDASVFFKSCHVLCIVPIQSVNQELTSTVYERVI